MKRIIIIFLILLSSSSVFGQVPNVESLMTRRYLSCPDIYQNIQHLIPEFYKKGSIDTLNAILNYWSENCGTSEKLTRCKILLAIDQGNLRENTYDTNILNYLIGYKNGNSINYGYGSLNNYNNWNYRNLQPDTLDKFTVQLAKSLLERNQLNPIETFFLRIYSNDFENTFAMIRNEAFNGTVLQELYYNEVHKIENGITGHGDYILGAWIPQDNLKLIGSHLFLGLRGGFKYKRLMTDATIGFRFGKSANIYQVHVNDSIWDTDHFFGGYIGLDLGFELIKFKTCEFDLIGGIAFDGFDALQIEETKINTDISKSINSLNLNVGLGYKHFFNSWNYIGIDFKYNFINYKNPRGTDLSGNAFTINLIYGFNGNKYNGNRLKDIDYE